MKPAIIKDLHAGEKKVSLLRNTVSNYIQSMMERYGRKDDFSNPDGILDRWFNGVAERQFRRTPVPISRADKDDMMLEALGNTITEKVIKGYDASRPIHAYFGVIFQRKLSNAFQKFVNSRSRELNVDNLQNDEDEGFSTDTKRNLFQPNKRPKDPQERAMLREFMQGFRRFLERRQGKEWTPQIFDGLMQGYKKKEIADDLGISPGLVSQKIKMITEHLKEYARREKDTSLIELIKVFEDRNRKESSEEDTLAFESFWREIAVRSMDPKEVAGNVTKLKFTRLAGDPFDPEIIENQILSDRVTSKDMEDVIKGYEQFLTGNDDIIEDDGEIVGIRVIEAKNAIDEESNVDEVAEMINSMLERMVGRTATTKAIRDHVRKEACVVPNHTIRQALDKLIRSRKICEAGIGYKTRRSPAALHGVRSMAPVFA